MSIARTVRSADAVRGGEGRRVPPVPTHASAVRVNAPARLHLGFLDPGASLGRRFGSLGLVIEGFDTVVMLARAAIGGADDLILAAGALERDAVPRAREVLAALRDATGVRDTLTLHIEQVPPSHAGFGTGTQLALAIGRAFATLHDLVIETPALARITGRGLRSGVGIAGFDVGGLLVDAGPSPAPGRSEAGDAPPRGAASASELGGSSPAPGRSEAGDAPPRGAASAGELGGSSPAPGRSEAGDAPPRGAASASELGGSSPAPGRSEAGDAPPRGAASASELGGSFPSGAPAPLVARVELPAAWRVLLVLDPRASGLHGDAERAALARLAPLAREQAAALCHDTLMQVLPGAMEGDFTSFAAGTNRMQRTLGEHFAPAQEGRAYTSAAVGRALEALAAARPAAIGQSSWGPTGFAIVPSSDGLDAWLERARADGVVDAALECRVVQPRARGAVVARLP